jgi:eukaryotic-like serine/threonine-protein kinase
VKLIDFGVAKAANKVSNTLTGTIKGKYAYMSPEQARGEELDHRSDIFGLGTILYELLTGTRLWKRETDTATLRAVMSAKAEPPSSVVKSLPQDLDEIVRRALARSREERYQTAGELQLALEDFIVQQRLAATPAHVAAFMRSLFTADPPTVPKDDENTQVDEQAEAAQQPAKPAKPKRG